MVDPSSSCSEKNFSFRNKQEVSFREPTRTRESAGQTIAAGKASVGKSGAVQIHGSLSSGQKFSLASALSKEGNVPLFVTVGRGLDVLAGWLNFGGTDESGRGGKVYWVHAASSGVVLLEQASP